MSDWVTPIGPDGQFLLNGAIPIDAAHRAALPHRGVWLHVLSADGALLLVRRASTMATCPGLMSIIGELHQHVEDDDICAARAVREELPGLAPLLGTQMSLRPLRPRSRWFLFDYPPATPESAARYDRCLITEYVAMIDANSTEALRLLTAGREGELEHEASTSKFYPLGEFARWLQQKPAEFCAPELLPAALLDSLASMCAMLNALRPTHMPAGCNEAPMLGRWTAMDYPQFRPSRSAALPERLDLHRVSRGVARWETHAARAADVTTPSPVVPHAPVARVRDSTEEAVCEMPDWFYGCKGCDSSCQAAGNWVADCRDIKAACKELYMVPVGQRGTGISVAWAEREAELQVELKSATKGSKAYERAMKQLDELHKFAGRGSYQKKLNVDFRPRVDLVWGQHTAGQSRYG